MVVTVEHTQVEVPLYIVIIVVVLEVVANYSLTLDVLQHTMYIALLILVLIGVQTIQDMLPVQVLVRLKNKSYIKKNDNHYWLSFSFAPTSSSSQSSPIAS